MIIENVEIEMFDDSSRHQEPISISSGSRPSFWSILVLMIRLTINCASSAKCVAVLWTRRFIAMVPTARYTVEVSSV